MIGAVQKSEFVQYSTYIRMYVCMYVHTWLFTCCAFGSFVSDITATNEAHCHVVLIGVT